MEQVTTLFPTAFPALALAHFMALLSSGPDFFLTGRLRHTLPATRQRWAVPRHCGGKWALHSAGGDWVRATASDAAALDHHRTVRCRLPAMGGPSIVEKPCRAAGVAAARRIGMSVTGKTAIAGARLITAESEKCSVLSGANDRPAGPKRDRDTAGHMRNLDDQRSVTLGSAADNAYRPAANSTSSG